MVYNSLQSCLEDKLCCFGKKWNGSAATVKAVQNSRMVRFYVPGRGFACRRTSAGVSAMTPASGSLKKQRHWISQSTIKKILACKDGGQPLWADLQIFLFEHLEKLIFCQNWNPQLPGFTLLGTGVLAHYDEAGLL